jgi:hypothetical protein
VLAGGLVVLFVLAGGLVVLFVLVGGLMVLFVLAGGLVVLFVLAGSHAAKCRARGPGRDEGPDVTRARATNPRTRRGPGRTPSSAARAPSLHVITGRRAPGRHRGFALPRRRRAGRGERSIRPSRAVARSGRARSACAGPVTSRATRPCTPRRSRGAASTRCRGGQRRAGAVRTARGRTARRRDPRQCRVRESRRTRAHDYPPRRRAKPARSGSIHRRAERWRAAPQRQQPQPPAADALPRLQTHGGPPRTATDVSRPAADAQRGAARRTAPRSRSQLSGGSAARSPGRCSRT